MLCRNHPKRAQIVVVLVLVLDLFSRRRTRTRTTVERFDECFLQTTFSVQRSMFPTSWPLPMNWSPAVLKASRSTFEPAAAGLRHSRAPVQRFNARMFRGILSPMARAFRLPLSVLCPSPSTLRPLPFPLSGDVRSDAPHIFVQLLAIEPLTMLSVTTESKPCRKRSLL